MIRLVTGFLALNRKLQILQTVGKMYVWFVLVKIWMILLHLPVDFVTKFVYYPF